MTSALVSTGWLHDNMANPRIKIIDASYFPQGSQRNGAESYAASHLPEAVFFDIDAIAEPGTDLPHMLPQPALFEDKISALGIGNDDFVVAYDALGIFSAPRAWWMLRAMGHDNVAVLDGGLPKWVRENRPVTTEAPTPARARFIARPRPHFLRQLADMRSNLETRRELVLDARSPGRFAGTEPELWPGRRGGHIPDALNIPFSTLLTSGQTLRPRAELQAAFAKADLSRPLVASCGSGITACILALALHEMGLPDVPVYDGSWAEWGLIGANHPVETGLYQ